MAEKLTACQVRQRLTEAEAALAPPSSSPPQKRRGVNRLRFPMKTGWRGTKATAAWTDRFVTHLGLRSGGFHAQRRDARGRLSQAG